MKILFSKNCLLHFDNVNLIPKTIYNQLTSSEVNQRRLQCAFVSVKKILQKQSFFFPIAKHQLFKNIKVSNSKPVLVAKNVKIMFIA